MGRAQLKITGEAMRRKAQKWVACAPLGTILDFRWRTRSRAQENRMWAMCRIIARKLRWHGAYWSETNWKEYFVYTLKGERLMPHEDGYFVPVSRSQSDLTPEEHSDLTALIEAFAARQGIDLQEGE